MLHAYTSAFNRGELSEVLALMSDDVVVLGIDACRGTPCVGRKAAQDGYLGDPEDFRHNTYVRENVSWVVQGNRVTARFSTRDSAKHLHGAGQMRGSMRFTIRNGLITRVDNSFDLEDPQTVVIRHSTGEVIFALRAPDTDEILVRALIVDAGASATAIILEPVDRAARQRGLVARLTEGTCAKPGTSTRELRLVEGLDLEAKVDVALDRLLSAPFHLDLRLGDGTRVACGEVP